MKLRNLKNIAIIPLLFAAGCKQDVIQPQPAPVVTPPVVTYSKGNADFTKYVAIGNSLTAGFQAGALFTEGQNNSFPLILSKAFQAVGGATTFNQPDINSVNGYYGVDPITGAPLGRLILFAADGNQADAVPTPAGSQGVPAPYNTADFPAPYTGNKAALNNFGVPGILLGQALAPQTGGPPTGNPYYNPLYARFASNPGTSTIIGDAIAAQPTFFTFDLGNNDILGYATNGGDKTLPLTSQSDFQNYYGQAIGALLNPATNPHNPKGAITTIPDVTTIPFFYTVPWNAIPLDASTAAAITSELATGYNGFLLQLQAGGVLSAAEVAKRTLKFSAGQNAIVITDSDLTDLKPYMTGAAAALLPYAKARQTSPTDLVILPAGGILGTVVNNNPTLINGVTVPLTDHYVLVPSEIDSILTATAGFNTTIKAVAAQYPGKIAVVDVNAAFKTLVTNQAGVYNGVTITPSLAPPTGGFSEDGVHPNSRGYAFLANLFIQSIDAEFSATLPLADLSKYNGTGLPLTP